MITRVSNGRGGQMVYEFDNGNQVSILWALGSYSDNHDLWKYKDSEGHPDWDKADFVSSTVEVYSMGTDTNGFTKYLERKYGQNPAAYVPVADIPKILSRADRSSK